MKHSLFFVLACTAATGNSPDAEAAFFRFLTDDSLIGRTTFDAFLGNADDIVTPGINTFGGASQFVDSLGTFGYLGGTMSTQSLSILGPRSELIFGNNEHTALSMIGEWNNSALFSFNNPFTQTLNTDTPSVITINPDQTYTSSFVVDDVGGLGGRVQFTGSGRYLLRNQDPTTLYSGDLLGHFNFVTPLLSEFWVGVAHETQTYTVLDGALAGTTGVNTMTFFSEDGGGVPTQPRQPLGAPWQVAGLADIDATGTSIGIGSLSLDPAQDGTAVLSGGSDAAVNLISLAGTGSSELRVEGVGTTLSRAADGSYSVVISTGFGGDADVIVTDGARMESGVVYALNDGHANILVSGPGSTLDLGCEAGGICDFGAYIIDQGGVFGSGSMSTIVENGGRIDFSAPKSGRAGIGAFNQTIVIDGPGSEVTISGSQSTTNVFARTGVDLEQGSSLSVTNGGKLHIERATAGFNGVGAGARASNDTNKPAATILVDGAGSIIDADALFGVGERYVVDSIQNAWIAAGAGGLSVATVRNGGVVKADAIRIGPSGTITGNGGTLEGNVENNGTLAPGESPGTLNIVGDYVQTSDGILVIEIGGTAPGSFDVLNISGKAKFQGGTLKIQLVDGFTPGETDTFEFLVAALFEGDFDTYDLPTFGAGRTFAVNLGPGGLRAAVTAVPVPAAGWLLVSGIALVARQRHRA